MIVVGSCSGFILGLVVGVGGTLFLLRQLFRRPVEADLKGRVFVPDYGEPTIGWLIQANEDLYRPGPQDLPAFVLVSPDPTTAEDEDFMIGMVDRLNDLRRSRPQTPHERAIARFLAEEMYDSGKRMRVPKLLADGQRLYIAHIWVYRRHLFERFISQRSIPCYVDWDDAKEPVVSRPRKARGRKMGNG